MTDDARPAQEEATDVANAVLDGSDAILLGAETRDLHTVETISTVGKIAEKVFHHDLSASVTVRAAIKVNTSVIICFTTSGRAARLTAKYRPSMLVLSVAIPHLKTNQLKWSFTGAFEVVQDNHSLFFLMLVDPRHPAESTSAANESVLKVYLDHGKASGVMNFHDCVVVRQIAGESLVVKILSWMTGHVY
ncbi:hypothetical protein SETIT_8G031600v2 [Setaria italica]|uniref:Pyruvate kinase C-terminal domain-containing protein n=1 Tax=Setaria italica TaxID=4555 RepID=K3ZL46_SETIT|nr:hypothetical protein SETIT_8G031600v2 [Setaria italica]